MTKLPQSLDSLLTEIEKRCEAATEGPLLADKNEWPGNENLRYWVGDYNLENESPGDGIAAFIRQEDAELFAHARTDVPALLAVIRKLIDNSGSFILGRLLAEGIPYDEAGIERAKRMEKLESELLRILKGEK